ncbi:P-loop containing nucleoside triphosphate hydrolase protein [Xylariomycetidae sp. FL0641]|nr:P-loop containing nucleoside triphosphate hydrolase protein [Xylariomycetidae sp. FL0641]
MLVTAIAVVLITIIVTWKEKFAAGNVSVSLVMVMSFSSVLARLIKTWTTMESSIGAVARVKQFASDTESEEKTGWTTEVSQDWPMQGSVEFRGLVAAHSPSLDPVLRGVSFSMRPSEHIALCGRSGSGKTSVILALLQMIETRQGQVIIDGIDVSSLPCTDIRRRLNVVPQDPLLLPGTVRFNVDPFGTVSDEDIVGALRGIQLWSTISDLGGLDSELNEAAWSAGQKQLLCLARTIIRKSKVLILDEATSSVDGETEAIMRDIIDRIFNDCTVLAVMHRLTHIARYDRVAVLDDGHLMEFDAPEVLLSQDSRFAKLFRTA